MPEPDPYEDAPSLDTRITLLMRLQSGGSERSWHDFFEMYRHYVLSLAIRHGLDRDLAHDVLQLVMMTVVREAHGFHCDSQTGTFQNFALIQDGDGHQFARFRSWLKGLVQVKIWDMRRLAALPDLTSDEAPATLPEDADPDHQPDEAAEYTSEQLFRRALMDQALLNLRENYRGSLRNVKIFESIALHGLTYSQAATTYEVTEVYARQIVHKLKARLKSILVALMQGTPTPRHNQLYLP